MGDDYEGGFSGRASPARFLQHELDAIADRLFDHFAARLDGPFRAIIREELKMTDQAILDLTAADDAILAELAVVVTTVHDDAAALAAALANSGASNDPAIQAQVTRLTAGTQAAKDAMAALVPQSPAAATPAAAPAAAATVGQVTA
jgi:hypothetical protein